MSINKGCSSKLWYTNCIEYYNTIKSFEDNVKNRKCLWENVENRKLSVWQSLQL